MREKDRHESRFHPVMQGKLFRFGPFDFDPFAKVLRRRGRRLKLRPQVALALGLLLERAGRLVTREELREALWGHETHVDFERGLNTCIRELRAILGDDAGAPRFIETLPGRGYRFVAAVAVAETEPRTAPTALVRGGTRTWRRPRPGWMGAIGAALALAVSLLLFARLFVKEQDDEPRRLRIVLGDFHNQTAY